MKIQRVDISWNPELPIFASEPFLQATGDEYGWIGGFADNGRLLCVLPYTIVRKAIFRMARFRVETIMLEDTVGIEEEREFLEGAIGYLRSIHVDMVIPATTNSIFRTYPKGADAAPYGSYIIDLCQSEETLWSNLSTSHRRKVRLAMKHGIEIKSGIQYADTAYAFVRNTFMRSKIPFMSYGSFKRYLEGLGDNVKIFLAESNGVVQGCLVVPYSYYCAYYVYGGSIPEPTTGAMNMLHWEAIKEFRERGVKNYDFVGVRIKPIKGSKQEGLSVFKERFGGKLSQGYMWKCSLNRLKYACYSQAVRFLRGGDIVDSERHKLILPGDESSVSFQ